MEVLCLAPTPAIAGAIRKTPKWYLRDWSRVRDPGKRCETMLACHLLKAVQLWTDLGLGEFDLLDGPFVVPARTRLSQLP